MTPPNNRAASAYRNVAIDSRAQQHDQYQLVVMMFETVLECLAVARGAIEQHDVELKVRKISQAIRIVHEGLRTSLDLENGGELARNLANLYEYAVLQMTKANASNDATLLEEVGNLIRPVADAWNQMRNGQQQPATETPATGQQQASNGPAAGPSPMKMAAGRLNGYGSHAMPRGAVFA